MKVKHVDPITMVMLCMIFALVSAILVAKGVSYSEGISGSGPRQMEACVAVAKKHGASASLAFNVGDDRGTKCMITKRNPDGTVIETEANKEEYASAISTTTTHWFE